MLKMVHWNEELGKYTTSVENLVNKQDLINYIGLLQDEVEKLENEVEKLEKEIKGE